MTEVGRKSVRIPYDSFTLQAVVEELRGFIGGKVQDIRQPNETDLSIGIYHHGSEGNFFLCAHPEYARAHFITKRLSNQPSPPVLCATLRSRVEGARLVDVEQVQRDRVLILTFSGDRGMHRLVAEIMGKHSNLILVDEEHRVISAMKWVPAGKSSRPIQPNSGYLLPPVLPELGDAAPSPFLTKLLLARGDENPGLFQPVLSPGNGAYPISVAALGLPEFSRSSISIALEQHYAVFIPQRALDTLRSSLLSQLHRVILAKEVALDELSQAEAAGGRAPYWQRLGELILTYGPMAPVGSHSLDAWDYDGTELTIKLNPDLSFKDNAAEYFERAKKAKGRMSFVTDQLARIRDQRVGLLALVERTNQATQISALEDIRAEALAKRWLNLQATPSTSKAEKPYEGHRIRELQAPGGYLVLFGENADSNDYLTLRVAKSNDYWLHVRGDVSAHVVIQTLNHPEKVQMETLRFAAKVAVQNSRAKHAGYVPVDYTLKKYVRRMKGAPKGMAFYTHEKTLHVDLD